MCLAILIWLQKQDEAMADAWNGLLAACLVWPTKVYAVNLVCAFPALLASGEQESAVSGLSLPAEIQ